MKTNTRIFRFRCLLILFIVSWAFFDVMRDWACWSAYMHAVVDHYFGGWHVVKSIEQFLMISAGMLLGLLSLASTTRKQLFFLFLFFTFLKWSVFEAAAHFLVPLYSMHPHPFLYLGSISASVIFVFSAVFLLFLKE